MAEPAKVLETSQFQVTPATPVIGGIVEGCRLGELDENGKEDLRQALWQYGVLFFRDQHLNPVQQKEVGLIFAEELEQHSFGKTLADEGHPEVLCIERFQSDKAKTTTGHLAPRRDRAEASEPGECVASSRGTLRCRHHVGQRHSRL